MWATARLIATVGCDNVHLNCAATDVSYVEKQYLCHSWVTFWYLNPIRIKMYIFNLIPTMN